MSDELVRHHWPDEAPDVDERDPSEAWEAENEHARGLCDRCGHEGHQGRDCPTITPVLLRPRIET